MIILFHNLLSTVMTGNIFQIFRRMTIFSCIHLSVIPGFFCLLHCHLFPAKRTVEQLVTLLPVKKYYFPCSHIRKYI